MFETWLSVVGLMLMAFWSRRPKEAVFDPGRVVDPGFNTDGSTTDQLFTSAIPYRKGPMSRAELELLAVAGANRAGATPAVLKAFCDIETAGWDQRAANLSGGDGARGGAFGCPQITLATARAVDDAYGATAWRQIDPSRGGDALLDYPELAFELAGRVVAEAERRVRERNGTLEDVAAIYNSGKFASAAPASTRNVYIPKFLIAYARREAGRWS